MLVPTSLFAGFSRSRPQRGVFSIVAFECEGTAGRWESPWPSWLVILMLVHAALFGIVWLFTSLAGRGRDKSGQPAGSPFARRPTSGERVRLERPALPILLDQE